MARFLQVFPSYYLPATTSLLFLEIEIANKIMAIRLTSANVVAAKNAKLMPCSNPSDEIMLNCSAVGLLAAVFIISFDTNKLVCVVIIVVITAVPIAPAIA